MTAHQLRSRFSYLLNYEPTWFPEFGCGLGLMLWSAFCFLTDDLRISGADWALPSLGVLFGPLRWMLLFRIWPAPRAGAAAVGAVWWAWIGCGLAGHYGVVPMLGPLIALFGMDALTVARFSVLALHEIADELRERRAAR